MESGMCEESESVRAECKYASEWRGGCNDCAYTYILCVCVCACCQEYCAMPLVCCNKTTTLSISAHIHSIHFATLTTGYYMYANGFHVLLKFASCYLERPSDAKKYAVGKFSIIEKKNAIKASVYIIYMYEYTFFFFQFVNFLWVVNPLNAVRYGSHIPCEGVRVDYAKR